MNGDLSETIIDFEDQLSPFSLVSFIPPPTSTAEVTATRPSPRCQREEASEEHYRGTVLQRMSWLSLNGTDSATGNTQLQHQQERELYSQEHLPEVRPWHQRTMIGRDTISTNRQDSKDSNTTLTDSPTSLLSRRSQENYLSRVSSSSAGRQSNPKFDTIHTTVHSTPTRTPSSSLGFSSLQRKDSKASTTRLSMSTGAWSPFNKFTLNMPPPPHSIIYGVPSDKTTFTPPQTNQNEGGFTTAPSPSPFLFLNTLSPLSKSSPSLTSLSRPSPSGPSGFSLPPSFPPTTPKRYVDTRKRNKAQKDAFKTAKVLFSNERTFIHWIKFGMLLGALAMTLLNFSAEGAQRGMDEEEVLLARYAARVGKLVGVGLMMICLIVLVYAASIYHWRHIGVVNKQENESRYYDRIGPTALTIGLFIAYALNVFLTIQITSSMSSDYQPQTFYNHHPNSYLPRPPSSMPSSPAFDIPPLPPGSTILIDNDDDDDEDDDFDLDYPPSQLETESTSISSFPESANAVTQSHSSEPSTDSDDDVEDEQE